MLSLDAAHLANPAVFRHPDQVYDLYRRLRDQAPIARAEPEGYRPFWAMTRHADIFDLERQPEIYEAGPRTVLLPRKVEEIYERKYGNPNGVKPLTHMDGEYHRAHRAVMVDWFKAKNLKAFEPRIREIAKEFIDRMEDLGGACNFAQDVAYLFPLRVVLTLMGVPREDEEMVLGMTQRLLSPADRELVRRKDPGDERPRDVFADFADYFLRLGKIREADPRNDIASTIANSRIDGKPMARHEIISYYMIVATAGHDTTAASIGGGLLGLLRHPDQMELLRSDPRLLATAAEEFVRWTAPVKHFMRTPNVDVEWHGQTISAGEAIMLCFASACRDERVFGDADSLRVARPATPSHLAFGAGPHFCMGRTLASLEIRQFFAELLPRLKAVELTGDPTFIESTFVSGLKNLPIQYRMA